MIKYFKDPAFAMIALSSILALTNFLGTAALFVIFTITFFVIILKDGTRVFNQSSIKSIIFFYFIFVIYGFLGYGIIDTENYRGYLFSSLSILTVLLMSTHISMMTKSQIKVLFVICLVAITISISIASYVATINPMAIRHMFGDDNYLDAVEISLFKSIGLMSYPQAHFLCVLSPCFCLLACYAKNTWLRLFSVLLLTLTIKLQFDMTITTALLLSVLSSFAILCIKIANRNLFLSLLVFVLAAIVLLSGGIIIDAIDNAESENLQIFKKLSDLYETVELGSGQGQMGYRNELYMTSFNTFLSNPIFGLAKDNGSRMYIGEHSFLLDYLAYFGLFSMLFFIGWWKHFKNNVLNRAYSFKIECILCLVPAVLMVIVKAESVSTLLPFATLVFVPIVFFYLQNALSKN